MTTLERWRTLQCLTGLGTGQENMTIRDRIMTEFLCEGRTFSYLDCGGGFMNLPMWLNITGLYTRHTMRARKMVKSE